MIGTLSVGAAAATSARPCWCVTRAQARTIRRAYARRLAELGYVAFALDYNGGGKPLTDRQMRARIMS
jgi:hypothetical protein